MCSCTVSSAWPDVGVRSPIQVCQAAELLVLRSPVGRVPSGAKAAVLAAPSCSFLAAPQATGCLDTHYPRPLLIQPRLSPSCCSRTPRSATMQPPTCPRLASSSAMCHARCFSSSRPTTSYAASRLPWARAPAPAPSSTCRGAASEHWPRECGLLPLVLSAPLACPLGTTHLHFLPPVPRAMLEFPNVQISLQEVEDREQLLQMG